MSRENVFPQHVDDGSGNDDAFDGSSDTHGKERHAVEKVDRAVERVNDPLHGAPRIGAAALFTEYATVG